MKTKKKKFFDFRSVKIPPKMSALEKDHRGFPIPYNVFRDKNNKPFFTINDDEKYIGLIEERCCAICGSSLDDDMWFVGGIKSAFHEKGCFIDSPVHYECGQYALKVCPHLAASRYTAYLSDDKINKLQEKVGDTIILIDPTVDANRPDYFAIVKCSDYKLIESAQSTFGFYLKPQRPYLKFELWKDGKIVFPLMYKSIISGVDCILMPEEMQKLLLK